MLASVQQIKTHIETMQNVNTLIPVAVIVAKSVILWHSLIEKLSEKVVNTNTYMQHCSDGCLGYQDVNVCCVF